MTACASCADSDTTNAAPAHPSQGDLAAEAARAAAHFGNTNASVNTTVQYAILTATGNNASGAGSSYCAWHSSTSSAYGTLAYTNSLGWNLTADVTPGTVVRDGNAVTFDGTITSTNAYGGGGYIHAKVVDGGGATCGGDTIVVFVNEPAYDGIFANVTGGDLVIH